MIIEVHEDKLEHLEEYAKKVIKYAEQMLHCIDVIEGEEEEEEVVSKSKKKAYHRYY